MLQKLVYLIEYPDDREKLNKTSLSEKEDFYYHLKTEDITGADYMHGKKVCKDFETKNLREHHDLHIQIDTLLLADVWELSECLSWNNCILFLTALGLEWQAASKKTKTNSDLLTDIDMFWMVKKSIRGGICHAIHRYGKTNNKYLKDYEKK